MKSSYELKRPELKPIISNFGNDVKGELAVARIDFMLREAQHDRKSHMISP